MLKNTVLHADFSENICRKNLDYTQRLMRNGGSEATVSFGLQSMEMGILSPYTHRLKGIFRMRKRSLVMFAAVLFAFSGIMAKIYDLSGGQLFQTADQQSSFTLTIANSRGTIYDRNMTPLTNTGTERRACISPNPEVLAILSKYLDEGTWESVSERLQDGRPVVVQLEDKAIPLSSGLSIYTVPVRHQGEVLAPHLLGYLGSDGLHGVTGIELAFDEELSAAAGSLTVTFRVDGSGRALQGEVPTVTDTLANSKAGVALTIDAEIQKIAEEVAYKGIEKGAVVILEPSTGRILAMVSVPDYQPDHLADYLEDPDAPLLNRALCNYNCGSVFKIVSVATALGKGIPVTQTFACSGSLPVGTLSFGCSNRLGHGVLDMTGGFAQSCNPYFIQLMQTTGGQALYEQAVTLGFDRPILLAEGIKTARATLPSETELQSPGVLANLSFGQGSLLATPVHVAQLVATVVNDGLMIRPTILQGMVDANGTLTEESTDPPVRAFSSDIAAELRRMMIEVVENGTGKEAKPLNGGGGGKTGTAETGWVEDDTALVQSWFAGFYPAENPRYAIAVLAEDTNRTGSKSAPVYKEICENLYLLEKT